MLIDLAKLPPAARRAIDHLCTRLEADAIEAVSFALITAADRLAGPPPEDDLLVALRLYSLLPGDFA